VQQSKQDSKARIGALCEAAAVIAWYGSFALWHETANPHAKKPRGTNER
jgi:hypothetical protein